jgi:hypothetical protein
MVAEAILTATTSRLEDVMAERVGWRDFRKTGAFFVTYTRVFALITNQHCLDEIQAERVSIQHSSYCKVVVLQGGLELC